MNTHQNHNLERYAGFTLIEMLVTLSIMLILTTVALPSFSNFTANQEIKNTAQSLYQTLLYARVEAIKRNSEVYVYPNGGTANDWQKGWLVSTDDATQSADCTDTADEANVLRVNCAVSNNAVRFADSPPAAITFRPSGRTQQAQITLCDDRSANATPRTIKLALGGLARIEQGGDCS